MKRRADGIEFGRLVSSNDELSALDAEWVERGYARASARAWRCRDDSTSVRLVWRKRGAVISTVTCVLRGLVLA